MNPAGVRDNRPPRAVPAPFPLAVVLVEGSPASVWVDRFRQWDTGAGFHLVLSYDPPRPQLMEAPDVTLPDFREQSAWSDDHLVRVRLLLRGNETPFSSAYSDFGESDTFLPIYLVDSSGNKWGDEASYWVPGLDLRDLVEVEMVWVNAGMDYTARVGDADPMR